MKEVKIYSTSTCQYCDMAKEYFKGKGVEYAEYNVGEDLERRKEMVEKTGQMGVPVVSIGDEYFVGYNPDAFDAALAS